MAARRAAPPSPPVLTDRDVDQLRERLAVGERPRVIVRSASAAVPAGTRGTVVRLGDPAQDEYVVVRIGRDEVPFSPTELSLPGAKVVAAATATRTREPAVARSAGATRRAATPDRAAAGASRASVPATAVPPPQPAPTDHRPTARPAGAARRRSAARPATPRRPAAPLTVTLRFSGEAWTAEAARGSRRLARPGPLRPGAVSALAEHVDDEALRSALVDTVEACRAVVEERAAQLRAQLDDAEATLRDYETRPPRR